MHLYGIVRGRPQLVRRFKENCEDVFIPLTKVIDEKTGKKEKFFVQLIPRKVELVEFVFPEDYLPNVVKTFKPHWNKIPFDTTEIGCNFAGAGLRKILKAKKLKNMDLSKVQGFTTGSGEPVKVKYADLSIVGVKKDKKDKNGVEVL